MWWVVGAAGVLVLILVPALRLFARDADMGTVSSDWLARQKLDRRTEYY